MSGLQEVWDYLGGDKTVADIADVERGGMSDADRPVGECWPCKKFADKARLHESPARAECCRGCDAYRGIGNQEVGR